MPGAGGVTALLRAFLLLPGVPICLGAAAPMAAGSAAAPLAVVTGANTGIGYHVAGQLAARGFHVVLACRSAERAQSALADMRRQYGADISAEFQQLDLTSFSSVQSFVEGLRGRQPSLLVCNAGLNSASVLQGAHEQLTADGVDVLYQTNFLAHFYLVLLVLPMLVATGGRVLSVTSVVHRSASPEDFGLVRKVREPYLSLYGLSKLAQILANVEFHRRFGARGVAFHCVNPGGVASDIWRGYPAWKRWAFARLLVDPEQAARTVVEACLCEEGAAPAAPKYWNGYLGASRHPAFEYWSPLPAGDALVPSEPSDDARDPALAQRLWDESLEALREAGVDVEALPQLEG